KLLKDPTVEIHVYDHHPRTPYDIKGDVDVFQEVGATVTILLDILKKKKKVKITPLEATIMLLAIYEETGSLTYRTTTRLDVDMVSFLLSKGANLQAISSYLNRKLTEEELAFLTSLITSTKITLINGFNIAIAEGVIKKFVGELGTIVRKLQDVENLPVLFALFKTGEKVRIIARSRIKEIDVNKILKKFGGGGHRSAASARVDHGDIETIKNKLLDLLRSTVKIKIFAKDIMTHSVKTISSGKKIKDAKGMLEKFRLKGAPVMEKNKLLGIITMSDIRKALKYRYHEASVKGYMARSVITVAPDTPLHTMQGIMLDKKVGRLPVMKGDRLLGIVTRTDILKSVHRDIFRKHKNFKKRTAQFNISTKMKRVLPKEVRAILLSIGKLANRQHSRAFVVGGFVRDILLGVKNFDMDIVIEGDAISFGRKLANFFKGSHVAYPKFGTSTIVMDWPKGVHKPSGAGPKFKIDVAAARCESYEKPAALPTVRFSSLKDDLQRRDFTINAMAASIDKGNFGQLIDFFGGERDLERGVIRVLHDGSFIDDPTRIFRAVRFEQRLGFRLDKYTQNLIKHAIREGMFSKTQNHRIRDELILILKEEEPIKAIFRMKELHELRFIHKKIRVDSSTRLLFSKIKKVFLWYNGRVFKKRHIDLWLMYLMALLERLTPTDVKAMCEKFAFRRSDSLRLASANKNCAKALKKISMKSIAPSEVYKILNPLSFEEILFIMAKSSAAPAALNISNFFAKHNNAKIKINGHDLKKLGIKPGPLFKKLLAKVLYKKIDGEIKSKKDELNFIQKESLK
ncbi:MAG: CBS domain-containing protein, partial [Candidatus Omnitrophota bacterium]